MTTAENLFVNTFDRKNWIIEQVKRRTESYSHYLASKLLVHGITPPPCLWNPKFNSQTSATRELKKEELISQLLNLHPAPAVPYLGIHRYWHNKPNILQDNGELSEWLFKKTHESNKGVETGERPTTVPKYHENDTGCALNPVHELDHTISSPQQQIYGRLSNIHSEPGQSLVGIGRSKSRQKDLELRESAKATSKSRFGDGNETYVSSNGIRPEKGECLVKENDDIIFCGRSSCNLSSHDGNSSDMAKEIGAQMTCPESKGVLKPFHLSDTTSQRVTQSKPRSSKMSLLINSLDRSGKSVESMSSDEVVHHCPNTDAVVNQEGKVDRDSETALTYFDVKKCRPDISTGKGFGTSVESPTSLDKLVFEYPSRISLTKQPIEQGVLTRSAEAQRVSSVAHMEECLEVYEEVSKSEINKNLKNAQGHPDAFLETQHLPFSHGGDISVSHVDTRLDIEMHQKVENHTKEALSNADKSPNLEMHQNVNYHLAQVIETSPDLQLEQDKIGSEMRYKITNTPSTFECGNLGTSFVSIVTKEEARGSHGCSSENVEEADSSIIRDVWKQCDQQNFNILVHSENTVFTEIEDDLAHTESILQETKPQFKSDCLYIHKTSNWPLLVLIRLGLRLRGSQLTPRRMNNHMEFLIALTT